LYMKNYQLKIILLFLVIFNIGIAKLFASELPKVQILTENLQLGESHYYNFSNLQKGDTIYVNMERISGNLDPILGITKDRDDFISFEDFYIHQIPESLEKGLDFTEIFPDFANEFFIAWDDNGGKFSDSSLTYQVQEEGDYQLVVSGSYYQLRRDNRYYSTFGKYRLSIGVNAPEVLTGEAKSTKQTVISPVGKFHNRVQEINGEITGDRKYIEFPLRILDEGDTLYVYVEKTSGDLKPTVKLRDYGNRLLSFDNISGEDKNATLQYTLKEEGKNYTLVVRGDSEGEVITEGKFRILIGTNAPEVLTGKSDTRGRPIISEPIEVNVSLLIDQITSIDQRKESFTVVGYLVLKWVDPGFAYNPDSCKCNEMDYTSEQFDQYIKKNHLDWPRFLILNQQGKRFIQEDNFRVYPDGGVSYFERFTVTLQAPDFDFRRFPFDPQQFFFKLLLFTPIDFYVFKPNKELPAIGDKLGEEEWLIYDYHSVVKTKTYNKTFSEYTLQIDANRHVDYYMFRIFIPLLLIIIVSWGTLFMRDYSNRISVSVAVLLIFVAFNFTIGSDLPRLGYMTFMDGILFAAFLITALTVLFNVFLRRMETTGKMELADTLDRYITIAYPIIYLLIIGSLIWIFFY
jgi:hypothetical protein